MSDQTAVATTGREERKSITALLTAPDARARITPMLRGVEYDRIVGEVYLASSENPEILKCTPASIVRAVARACGWGLEIGQTVHLVPFNVKVSLKGEADRWEKRLQAIRDYKGDIELIVATGAAKAIRAQAVYEREEYVEGTAPTVRHIPARNAKDRGALIGAYAIADHGYNRPAHVVYMPLAEIDDIRQEYSKQWKRDACPPWYARKTVIKQLAKMLPKNRALSAVLAQLEHEVDDGAAPDHETPLEGAPVATVSAPSAQQPERAADDSAAEEQDDTWMEREG